MQWIKNNLRDIARNISLSLADYFDVPFITPEPEREGIVTASALNIRAMPNTNAPILRTVLQGTVLEIEGSANGWYTVEYDDITGYVAAQYVAIR